MKRFLKDASLIFILFFIGSQLVKYQPKKDIDDKIKEFETEINENHSIKPGLEESSLYQMKENKASLLAKASGEAIVYVVEGSVTFVFELFSSIYR